MTVIVSVFGFGCSYIIRTENKIQELQQDLLIAKANEEQSKIEIENNKKIIMSLNKQLQMKNEKKKKKNKQIKQSKDDISKLTTEQQIITINNIFDNL